MTYTRSIDNDQDTMDSREVIAYMEALKSDIVDGFEEDDEIPEFDDLFPDFGNDLNETEGYLRQCDEKDVGTEAEELLALVKFADEAEGTPDWLHGETLIRDSYFEEYAQQLAEDICPSREVADAMESWPYSYIDWEAAAKALKQDYFEAEYDGVVYWVRS